MLTKSAEISNQVQKFSKKEGKLARGQKWWVLFAIYAFWPWYGVQNTSRECIFIHPYSHENISRIVNVFFYAICIINGKYITFFVFSILQKIWKWRFRVPILMNFRDIFMRVMVNGNTSPGSVLNIISWSESMYCKKAPSFLTPR